MAPLPELTGISDAAPLALEIFANLRLKIVPELPMNF